MTLFICVMIYGRWMNQSINTPSAKKCAPLWRTPRFQYITWDLTNPYINFITPACYVCQYIRLHSMKVDYDWWIKNCKWFQRKPNQGPKLQCVQKDQGKQHTTSVQHCQYSSWNMKQAPPKYKSRALRLQQPIWLVL